jgi:hypothetical protein
MPQSSIILALRILAGVELACEGLAAEDVQELHGVCFIFGDLNNNMISQAGFSALRQARTQLRPQTGTTPIASISALARLLSSLAVLEQRDGKLNPGSLGAVTAAQKLGGSIVGFVAGSNIKAVAEEAAKIKGIERIIAVDNAAYDKVRTCENSNSILVLINFCRGFQKTLLHC